MGTNCNVKVYKGILRDIGNYSYPILSVQRSKPIGVFIKYSYNLARMGFWKSGLFYIYFMSLLVLGERTSDWIIRKIKRQLGGTPVLGRIYKGKSK